MLLGAKLGQIHFIQILNGDIIKLIQVLLIILLMMLKLQIMKVGVNP